MPSMPGMTEETAKNLKWKSLKWMITQDTDRKVLKGFLRHPLRYAWGLIKSAIKSKPYKRDEDFFLYGIESVDAFSRLLEDKDTLLVVGFSYCHKP
jgi:hypothetical protein